MSNSKRAPRSRTLLVALVASLAFAGIASASASAATWVQGTTTMKWSGASTITLKKAGGSATTCTWPSSVVGDPASAPYTYGAQNVEGSARGGVTNFGALFSTRITCAGGKFFSFCSCFETTGEGGSGVFGVNLVDWWPGTGYTSPYGSWNQAELGEGVFTNGSGGTPSTLSFNESLIGYTNPGYQPITMTASFKVSDMKGGLLTLK